MRIPIYLVLWFPQQNATSHYIKIVYDKYYKNEKLIKLKQYNPHASINTSNGIINTK